MTKRDRNQEKKIEKCKYGAIQSPVNMSIRLLASLWNI